MNSDLKALWLKLAAVGVRPTRQRLELAQIIFGRGERHFTAETIYAEGCSFRYPPSLGTIYNTLKQFVTHGLLREIALYDAKVWFDTSVGPHCHYYFEDTHELADIPLDAMPALNISAPPGSEVTAIDVIVRVKHAHKCPGARLPLD